MAFVHLHVHSQFSILDGSATVDALAARAAERGFTTLALTDTGNLFGGVAFYKACKSRGIHAIIGAELHVQPEGIAHADPDREEGGYQLVVLVEDATGYQNLCRLVTDGVFEGMHYKPRVDLERLARYREGLVFLTSGTKGVLGRALLRGEGSKATSDGERVARQRFADLLAAVGADRLFLELQDLGVPGQEEVNDLARALSGEIGVPTVVTNAVHYLDAEDAPVHDLLNAIGTGASLQDPTRLQCQTDQAWLKSEAELRALFPDDGPALDRTVEIAERCHFKFQLGVYHFPAAVPPDPEPGADTDANWAYFYAAFPPPRDFGEGMPPKPDGCGNLDGYFGWYARRGFELRLQRIAPDKHAQYRERLERELAMIGQMGFPAYMLIVAEFINWSKDHGVPVGPGRGSAAGSVVTWAMRITDIDPIRFELLFERFLNPERVNMPDIDVDFAQDRREEAIAHVREKYGADYVSQIITYGALKAKAAVRDVARVLDLNFNEADRIAKLVPETLGIKLSQAIEQEPRLRDLRDGDPKVRRVLALAQRIEGTYRQTGVHAAGVVISDRPLVEYAPLYRDEPDGGPVVQFDMKSAETIGLIKFDFLGLKTLDQIRDTLVSIERNHGVRVDMSAIDEDDAETYALLQEGDALGVFQLESSGMRELLTRLKPSSMDDMVALVALYRPGPLQSGMVDDYVERKHGRTPVVYPLPLLEPILRPTYGTMIYQEQVMRIAQVLSGYSLGEADLLRRAMGKKNLAEMAKQQQRFVEGAVANGHPREAATGIFDDMAKFAAYGFNKSHSAAYGYIAYQTAWLKAHYRAEFMASLMTIEAANTDKVLTYILDCRRAGIRILPVCVNESVHAFSPGNQAIRFGLSAVRNVGQGSIDAILEARARGPFESAMDFFERVDPKRINRRVLECLIKAGALDFSGVPRRALLDGLDAAAALGARAQEDRAAGQIGLFAAAPKARGPGFRFPDVPEWPLSQKLAFEKEVLGLYLSGHPMQAHEADVKRYANDRPISRLAEVSDQEEARVLGLVVDVRIVRTRRNDKMAFVRLEDADASVECVFFAEAWGRSQRAIVDQAQPVLITGKIEKRAGAEGEEIKLLAATAEPLSELRARTTREVRFVLEVGDLTGDRLERFLGILQQQRGSCRSRLVVRQPGRFEAELGLPSLPVEPSTALEESVIALFGRPDVVALS